MKDKVLVYVKKIEEDGQIYFLAKSDDVPWFYAAGDTLEETVKSAFDVLDDMYKREQEVTMTVKPVYNFNFNDWLWSISNNRMVSLSC